MQRIALNFREKLQAIYFMANTKIITHFAPDLLAHIERLDEDLSNDEEGPILFISQLFDGTANAFPNNAVIIDLIDLLDTHQLLIETAVRTYSIDEAIDEATEEAVVRSFATRANKIADKLIEMRPRIDELITRLSALGCNAFLNFRTFYPIIEFDQPILEQLIKSNGLIADRTIHNPSINYALTSPIALHAFLTQLDSYVILGDPKKANNFSTVATSLISLLKKNDPTIKAILFRKINKNALTLEVLMQVADALKKNTNVQSLGNFLDQLQSSHPRIKRICQKIEGYLERNRRLAVGWASVIPTLQTYRALPTHRYRDANSRPDITNPILEFAGMDPSKKLKNIGKLPESRFFKSQVKNHKETSKTKHQKRKPHSKR